MATKFRLFISLLIAAIAALGVSCNDDDKTVESQRSAIERYLTSNHTPRLIAKEEVENSLEYNPPFYEKFGMDLYRYISTYYDSGRDERAEVVMGSEIEIRYNAYMFAGRKPTASSVYMTNDPIMIAELIKYGLNAEYWSEEPMKIKLGTTKIISGLERSLLGCREGDVVEAYMTQREAYDDKDIGIVKKNTPVMWEYTILSVKNN